jgi:hypothetical protein
MVSKAQKAKYEVTATLCLLAIFASGSFVAALLVTMIDIPDFISPLQRIEEAVRSIAQRASAVCGKQ